MAREGRETDRKEKLSKGSAKASSSGSTKARALVSKSSSCADPARIKLSKLKPLSSFLGGGAAAGVGPSPSDSSQRSKEVRSSTSKQKHSDPLEAIELSSDNEDVQMDSEGADSDEMEIVGFREAAMPMDDLKNTHSSKVSKPKKELNDPPTTAHSKGKQRAFDNPTIDLEVVDSRNGL